MKKFTLTIILLIFGNTALACSAPAQGTHWTHDQLIDRTATIMLVTPVSADHGYRFKVLQTLKGADTKKLKWRRFRSKDPHNSEDFNEHNDPVFWHEGGEMVMRAPFNAGACTAQFTFVAGEQYLVFKESDGHPHSAEIIKSLNDKWYQYVRARLAKNNKQPPNKQP